MRQHPNEEPRLEAVDLTEAAMRTRADEAMQQVLLREHPERFTTSNPPGTKAPRRLLPPIESGLTTNFD